MEQHVPIEPKYCVYLTIYKGNKLPPFYIGSSTVDRVSRGYAGSVKSKKYKDIFNREYIEHPQLFKTIIIGKYFSRKMATYKECKFQKNLNVVKSDMYINMSTAKDFGWFGMNTQKESSPVYGKRWKKTAEQIENLRKAVLVAFNRPEHKEKLSKMRKGKLQMSNKKAQDLLLEYKCIFNLYDSKPNLLHNTISKNGKKLSYERAFAIAYHKQFNRTVNGLYQILSKPRILKEYL